MRAPGLIGVCFLLVGCHDRGTKQTSEAGKATAAAQVEAAKAVTAAAAQSDESGKAIAAALGVDVATHVTGTVHSVGGALGTWDIALVDCRSGERNGFYGADFYVTGSDDLRLRYVHDEAAGEVVKVVYPTKLDTALQLDRTSRCSVLEGEVQRMNITSGSSNRLGAIRHLKGQLKFDCRHTRGKGRVTGEVTFTNCH
jgi:hypothetical protein